MLPLPLPNSGYYIEKLFMYLNDPRGSQNNIASSQRAALRWDVAVGAWTMLLVILINYLHSDRGCIESKWQCDAPRYTAAQQESIERIEEAAIYLCSRRGSEYKAPRVAWKNEVKALTFRYDEVVRRPEKITWAQIEAGLPPAEHCGSLRAVDFCSGPVRAALEVVDSYVLPLDEWLEISPAACRLRRRRVGRRNLRAARPWDPGDRGGGTHPSHPWQEVGQWRVRREEVGRCPRWA